MEILFNCKENLNDKRKETAMIIDKNSAKVFVKDAAQILEMDQSQTYKLFKENRIRNFQDEKTKRNYTTRSDLVEFLNTRIPSGFQVIENETQVEAP